jgi:hypothetical protein
MSKKHKISDIKIYNVCYSLRYTYDMRAYTAKKHKDATSDMTPTHGAIMKLGKKWMMLVTSCTWIIRALRISWPTSYNSKIAYCDNV